MHALQQTLLGQFAQVAPYRVFRQAQGIADGFGDELAFALQQVQQIVFALMCQHIFLFVLELFLILHEFA